MPRTARWLTRVSRPQNLWCDVTKAVLFAPPKWNTLQGGKACLLIRKNDHFTPTREIRQRVRALARHHPNGWKFQRHVSPACTGGKPRSRVARHPHTNRCVAHFVFKAHRLLYHSTLGSRRPRVRMSCSPPPKWNTLHRRKCLNAAEFHPKSTYMTCAPSLRRIWHQRGVLRQT